MNSLINGTLEVIVGILEYIANMVRAMNSALNMFANSLKCLSVCGSQNVIKWNVTLPAVETNTINNTLTAIKTVNNKKKINVCLQNLRDIYSIETHSKSEIVENNTVLTVSILNNAFSFIFLILVYLIRKFGFESLCDARLVMNNHIFCKVN